MSKRRAKSRRKACPICRGPLPHTSLPLNVPLGIPTYWSPEQALAIFELISEMRDIIGSLYNVALTEAAREQQYLFPPVPGADDLDELDPPF